MTDHLRAFVESVPEETLAHLTSYIVDRAETYMDDGRRIASNGGKDREHHQSMAQALYTLVDVLNSEWEGMHNE